MSEDGFLSRWARRKADVKAGRPAPQEPAAEPAEPLPPPASPTALATPDIDTPAAGLPPEAPQAEEPAAPPAPTLADVAALAPGDEISRFVACGVDEGVKRAALKKLFTDPRYNIMDGLDTYIDDYSKSDPIPPAMLRQMNQSKFLGLFADEEADNAPAAQSPPHAEPAATAVADDLESSPPVPTPDAEPAAVTAALPPAPDEDPDLQLQPDDAARRPGAQGGPGPERG